MFSPRAAERSKTARRDAVRREDDRRALGRLDLVLDEDRAARLEVANDVRVVDDLVPDVDRRAVVLERELDGLDGAFHAGAKAARRSKEDALDHGAMVAVPDSGTAQTRLYVGDGTSAGNRHEKGPRLGGVGAAGLFQVAHRGLRPGTRAAVRIAQWGRR